MYVLCDIQSLKYDRRQRQRNRLYMYMWQVSSARIFTKRNSMVWKNADVMLTFKLIVHVQFICKKKMFYLLPHCQWMLFGAPASCCRTNTERGKSLAWDEVWRFSCCIPWCLIQEWPWTTLFLSKMGRLTRAGVPHVTLGTTLASLL